MSGEELGGGEGKEPGMAEGGVASGGSGRDQGDSARWSALLLELEAAMAEPGFLINTAVSKRGLPFLHEAVGKPGESECLECLDGCLGPVPFTEVVDVSGADFTFSNATGIPPEFLGP